MAFIGSIDQTVDRVTVNRKQFVREKVLKQPFEWTMSECFVPKLQRTDNCVHFAK